MIKSFFAKFRSWQNSLIGKLLLRFWICLIFFFALIGSFQYYSLKSSLYQNIEQDLAADYNSIQKNLISWIKNNETPPSQFPGLNPGSFVAFFSNDFNLESFIYSYGHAASPLSPSFLSENPKKYLLSQFTSGNPFIVLNLSQEDYMLFFYPILQNNHPYSPPQGFWENGIQTPYSSLKRFLAQRQEINDDNSPILGFAVIGSSLENEEFILQKNLQSYIMYALLILIFGTAITYLTLKKPLKPLINMSITAKQIADGQYNLRIQGKKPANEIKQLQDALNHMLEQLEHALKTERNAKDQMSRFIADASHELRTPLTSIRGFLEILQRSGQTDKDTLDSAHKTMLIETERLIRLAEGLLTLNRIAQTDDTANNSDAPIVSAGEVLPELWPLIDSLMENRTLKINKNTLEDFPSSPESKIYFPLKTDELKQILFNLINNSIQHTSIDGRIDIGLGQTNKTITLIVQDNGRGIPQENLPHIFERFYRGDRSRSRQQGQGAGLGLSIVSEIVKVRGGQITAESEPSKGTKFIVEFNAN